MMSRSSIFVAGSVPMLLLGFVGLSFMNSMRRSVPKTFVHYFIYIQATRSLQSHAEGQTGRPLRARRWRHESVSELVPSVRTLRKLLRKLGVLGVTVPVAAMFPFRSMISAHDHRECGRVGLSPAAWTTP